MTKDQIDSIRRKTAEQLMTEIPGGHGYEQRVELAVECAMNLEWWRGYYAAKGASGSPPGAREIVCPLCDIRIGPKDTVQCEVTGCPTFTRKNID